MVVKSKIEESFVPTLVERSELCRSRVDLEVNEIGCVRSLDSAIGLIEGLVVCDNDTDRLVLMYKLIAGGKDYECC